MQEVSNKIQFPDLEREILQFWREEQIFQKSIDQRPEDRPFIFYDGPPFATGLPHYGHLLAGTIKDVIPRYKTMRNFKVERRFGWDTHGLPVEYEVEQDLKLNGAEDIREFGVGNFNEACRSIVLRYTSEWRETVDRMARWVDFENDYKTMDRDFMESVWWVFKQLWDKGLIYEGVKVVPYSWRVATPLSNFEANLNYKDTQDPSVTLRFRMLDAENTYILAWTTTPWTLPSNMALCAGPQLEYVRLCLKETGERYLLVASRVETYFEEGSYEIEERMKGTELKGRRYEPLFDFAQKNKPSENAWKIYNDDYVSDESGTGLVHLACFGEDDVRIFNREGIPIFDPVNEEGNFQEDMDFLSGLNVIEANRPISQKLKEKGLMFRQETIEHSYPFCWRTDTPLIYKPISTWFVNVESFRERMVEHNRKVHWVPGHIRDGRFGKWLENARDWAISRNRFWGTPLPIWKNEEGETLCFGSVEELEKASGSKVPDLHKQHVDELVFEHQGKTYHRVTEVLDCWFESGSMPYGQQHYPFENKELFEANFPANFICEGLDQTRGWFYTLVVIAQALFDKPAFHNCVVNGLILAEDGKKMSKRLKNYPDPTKMLDQYGADAIRLYMLNSPAVRGEDLRFSEKGLIETTRTLLLPLWNALAFLTTYARIDGWEPTPENLEISRNNPLDLWILSKLVGLIDEVRTQMDLYDLNRSVAPFVGFIDLLTNWYIRRSRRRFWKAGQGSDKLEAYATLFQVLRNLSRVIAPFVPFIADGIHRTLKLKGDPESVHLALFPEKEGQMKQDPELEQRMDLVLSAVTMGRALRAKHQLKIRQPLQTITLITATPEAQRILEDLDELIIDELNVKSVEISRDEKDLVQLSAKANFKLLGRRMGKKMKAVSQAIAAMNPEQIRLYQQQGNVELEVEGEGIRFEIEEILIQRSQKEGLLVETDNLLTVALDTEITADLLKEGLAREFVNKVQNMRKEKNLDVMDRIVTRYHGSKALETSLETHSDFIRTETLTNTLSSESNLEGEDWDLNGEACRISIEKAA
ncbi:MAG: isoleucine--tRNA ligase [Deltaproteobacteria bacterium]|nr:isoleucine--tRNA ligase [Deltaproteobacteria bacterium]|tara:strand:- start:1334 stop:4456 length:3123 start_codon:yes stop_codon:yes gene_type:complete